MPVIPIGIRKIKQIFVLPRESYVIARITTKRVLIAKCRIDHVGQGTNLRSERIFLRVLQATDTHACRMLIVESKVGTHQFVVLE